jgi:hypothetical protein
VSAVALSWLPGVLLWLVSVAVLLAFVQTLLTSQELQGQLVALLLMLAVFWWVYVRIPGPIRRWVQRGIKGRKSNSGHT